MLDNVLQFVGVHIHVVCFLLQVQDAEDKVSVTSVRHTFENDYRFGPISP
jgi:hypothetical protein